MLCSIAVAMAGCSVDEPTASSAGEASDDSSGQKVTVAGDSISFGLGSELRDVVPDDVDVKVIGEGGTGLARPDKFDWPDRLAELADDFPPTTLVFSVGSNDHQDIADSDGSVVVPLSNTDEWDAEYSARLGGGVRRLRGHGHERRVGRPGPDLGPVGRRVQPAHPPTRHGTGGDPALGEGGGPLGAARFRGDQGDRLPHRGRTAPLAEVLPASRRGAASSTGRQLRLGGRARSWSESGRVGGGSGSLVLVALGPEGVFRWGWSTRTSRRGWRSWSSRGGG